MRPWGPASGMRRGEYGAEVSRTLRPSKVCPCPTLYAVGVRTDGGVGGNENSKYLGASSSFDQAQGPTSRIPTEYERPWPSTSTMTWPEEPTPALPNVQLGETLNRSPIRLRNDPPQAAPDIPRSSSPYPNFTRQAPVGQPSMGQSPSNNNNTRGFLDSTSGFAGGIGGGTLNQAFAANNNRLSSGKCLTIFYVLYPFHQAFSDLG